MQIKVSNTQGRVTPYLDDEWGEVVECFRLGRIYTPSTTAFETYLSVPGELDLSGVPVFVITDEVKGSLTHDYEDSAWDRLEAERSQGNIKLPDTPFVVALSNKAPKGYSPTSFLLFRPHEDGIVYISHLSLMARNVATIGWGACLIRQDELYVLPDGLRFVGLGTPQQYLELQNWLSQRADRQLPTFEALAYVGTLWASMIAHAPMGEWVYAPRGPHSERIAKRRAEQQLTAVAAVRLIKTVHLLNAPPRLITVQGAAAVSGRQNRRLTPVWPVGEYQRRRPKSGGYTKVTAHIRGPDRDTVPPPAPWYLVIP